MITDNKAKWFYINVFMQLSAILFFYFFFHKTEKPVLFLTPSQSGFPKPTVVFN